MRRSDQLQALLREKVAEAAEIACALFEAFGEEIATESPSERSLVLKYGEVVDQSTAAGILDVTPKTIRAMVKDGRLQGGGTGVSVRSIAWYLDADRPTAQQMKRMTREATA